MKRYRFTDYYYEHNDYYGSWQNCLNLFKEATKNNPEGKFSIWKVSENEEEGILFYGENV